MEGGRQVPVVDSPDATGGSPYTNSAARAVAVVEFLALNPSQTFTLSEVARRCALRKSTAKVVLSVLHQAGWLTRSPLDLRYGLGPMLLMIGRAAEESRPEVNLARPVMLELSLELQRECVLSATTGDEIFVLESTGPGGPRGSSFASGQHGPFVAPYGATFVAWRAPAARQEWYDRSAPYDPAWVGDMNRILSTCVRRGYVVTVQSDPRQRMMQVMDAVSGKLSVKEIRETLKKELSQLPPGAYLLGQLKQKDQYLVDALQAPIFDTRKVPTFALVVRIGRQLEGTTVIEWGNRVRAAADQVTAAIAAHTPPCRRPS